jgi:hypothetical protein
VFHRTPSHGNRTRRRLLAETIRDAALLLAIAALPAAAVYRTVQEVNVVRILSGPGETISGMTAAGVRISVTSYRPSADPPPPCSPPRECPPLVARLSPPCAHHP